MAKKKLLKKAFPVFLTVAMALGMNVVSMAKQKESVSSLDIDLHYELSHGMTKGDVEVECDEDGVSSVSLSSISNTDYGKKPKVTLKLRADRDYTFKGLKRENVKISGDEAIVTKLSTSGSSSNTMNLTLTLPKIGSTDDSALEVSDVSWSEEDNGNVEWEQANDADQYEVKILRGSSTKETIKTNNTQYNFRDVIRANGKGTYRVGVRALIGSYKGNWTESDDLDVDEDLLNQLGGKTGSSSTTSPSSNGSAKGAWLRDNNGWWYCNADHSYPTNNWQQIDGYWFFFNKSGYMKTGWLQSPFSKKWYWLSTDSGSTQGRMLTSQWVDNGKYYVDSNGVWNGQSK